MLERRTFAVQSPARRSTVACTASIDRPAAVSVTRRSVPFAQVPPQENPTDVELLYEVDALELQIHKPLSSHLGGDIRTDAVWATIPHARNGRSSKVLLVDRHHRILTKQDRSALYQELKHHVHLSTHFCQRTQHDPTFMTRMKYAPRLQEIQHPHIVRLYGYFMSNRTLHVLTEFCQLGNLTCVLEYDERYERKHNDRLPFFRDQHALKEATRQICSAVAFLHESQLAHTNLNLGSVLVSDNGHMLICDFKEAIYLGGLIRSAAPPPPVQHGFAAPERFVNGDGYDTVVDLTKADAWSVGTIVFALVTRQRLFNGASACDPDFLRLKHLGFAEYYEGWKTEALDRSLESVCIPEDIKSLLCELLQVSPSKRSTVIDVIERFEWLRRDGALVDLDPTEWKI